MNTQTVNLDVTKRPSVLPAIYIGQGDMNGTTLVANIYDNGTAFTLDGYDVRFRMKLPYSVATYYVDGTVSGSAATFAIDESYAASVAGVTDTAYVEVLDGDTVVCSTNRMRVVVLESAYEGVPPAHIWDNGITQFLSDAQDAVDAAVDDADAATSRATAAAEAAEGVILDAVPTMSPTLKGGAMLGSGLEIDTDVLSIDLTDEATGESVTAADASYLASLTVDGKAVQDGTPTPSAPVEIEVVEPNASDEFGIKINNTLYPIDLQGNVLASLPDGTKDVLTVDSVGHVVLKKRVGVVDLDAQTWSWQAAWLSWYTGYLDLNARATTSGPEKPSIFADCFVSGSQNQLTTSTVTDTNLIGHSKDLTSPRLISKNGSTEETPTGLLYYPFATPQTIDLGYISMPAIPDGSTISITAQVTPTITASWWARGAAAIAEALKSLRDGLLARIEAIETAIADL